MILRQLLSIKLSISDNFRNKNTPSERATKIIKNQRTIFLFLVKWMQHTALVTKTKDILKNDAIMYIRLIRNEPQGSAITGRLVIDGRWFCNTLERKGYQILALFYPIKVTHSPRFKRLLPLVTDVPQRTGIRIHRGTKPEHSTGCILVVADNNPMPLHSTPYTLHPPQGRTTADVEQELTRLILKAQNAHEEIILEVIDFTPGTEYGYNHPCPPELQKPWSRYSG